MAAAEVEAADTRGAGFAARLTIARNLARKMAAPAQTIEDEGREYGRDLLEADPAVDLIFDQVEEGLDQPATADPEELAAASGYVRSVVELAQATDEGMEGLRGFLGGLEGISSISRDLRPPARQMRKGLEGMVDGHGVIQAWAERARELAQRMPDEPEHAYCERVHR